MVLSVRKAVSYLLITSIFSGTIAPSLQAMEGGDFPPPIRVNFSPGHSKIHPSIELEVLPSKSPAAAAAARYKGAVHEVGISFEDGDFPPPVTITIAARRDTGDSPHSLDEPNSQSPSYGSLGGSASPSRVALVIHGGERGVDGSPQLSSSHSSSSSLPGAVEFREGINGHQLPSSLVLGEDEADVEYGPPLPPRMAARRGSVVHNLTDADVELLRAYAKELSREIYRPSAASDSVFENIMGVPTVRDLFCSLQGPWNLLKMGVMIYASYIMSDVSIGLFDFSFFKQIIGLDNYYPYQAIQSNDVPSLAKTAFLYLFMAITLIPSFGSQIAEGYNRFFHFMRRTIKCDKRDLLYNPKNSKLIKTATITSILGAGVATLPKLYSIIQRIRLTGTYVGNAQYLSFAFYFLSNFYTILDSSTTSVHSLIHRYGHGDSPETARRRSVLLRLAQESITQWIGFSDDDKTARYGQLFSPGIDTLDERELYRMLFLLLDFGKIDDTANAEEAEEPAPVKTEPVVRKGLRWVSEGIATLAGPISFEVIRVTTKSQLTSLGCNESASDTLAYFTAAIGSAFTTVISRNVVRSSLHQVYDSWTGYKHKEDMASPDYNNSASGYTSHSRFRTGLTTYNSVIGEALGLTTGKTVYDNLTSFSVATRYSAGGVAMVAAGALTTLFLQRWTHKVINAVDKNAFQETRYLEGLSDPIGVMSDEVIEFARDVSLRIRCMPAEVVDDLYKVVLATPELRDRFLARLDPNPMV